MQNDKFNDQDPLHNDQLKLSGIKKSKSFVHADFKTNFWLLVLGHSVFLLHVLQFLYVVARSGQEVDFRLAFFQPHWRAKVILVRSGTGKNSPRGKMRFMLSIWTGTSSSSGRFLPT